MLTPAEIANNFEEIYQAKSNLKNKNTFYEKMLIGILPTTTYQNFVKSFSNAKCLPKVSLFQQ